MRKTAVMLLILLVTLSFTAAYAAPALTVGNVTMSDGEVRACAYMAGENYRETVEYYAQYLGIDYWSLEYPGGMTVEQCVEADVFRQLVITCMLCDLAGEHGVSLTQADIDECASEADSWHSTLPAPAFSCDDVCSLYEKQLISGRVYALMVLGTEVDEGSDDITGEASVVYTVEYLFTSSLDPAVAELMTGANDFETAADRSVLISYGTMEVDSSSPAAFLEALAVLEAGQTTAPIETDFGLFVLKLISTGGETAEEARNRAVYAAREEAFSSELDKLYSEASYTIYDSFRDAMTLR